MTQIDIEGQLFFLKAQEKFQVRALDWFKYL